jgi:hypothetical protein
MPTPTYTPLANVTLGSATSSVTFSSIPATYRDLILVYQYARASGETSLNVRFNGDTGSNYSFVNMIGSSFSGATSTSNTFTGITPEQGNQGNPGDTLRGVWHYQLMDYSATDKHKTVLQRHNTLKADGAQWTTAQASRWANTAAITSISFTTSVNMSAGSNFSLYGVIA